MATSPARDAGRQRLSVDGDWFVSQKSLDVLCKFRGARVAALRLLGERLQTDCPKGSRSLGIDLTRRDGIFVDHSMKNVVRVLTDERRAIGQDVVQNCPEPIDVTPLIHLLEVSLSLFRRHISRRTKNLTLHGWI